MHDQLQASKLETQPPAARADDRYQLELLWHSREETAGLEGLADSRDPGVVETVRVGSMGSDGCLGRSQMCIVGCSGLPEWGGRFLGFVGYEGAKGPLWIGPGILLDEMCQSLVTSKVVMETHTLSPDLDYPSDENFPSRRDGQF